MSSVRKILLKQKNRMLLTGILLLALLIVLAVLMMTIGSKIYTPAEVLEILKSPGTKGAAFTIKTLRLPKTVIGILAGFAFGMSGYTFQTILHNPLASPDIIGITSGSSVAAVFCILILGISGPFVSAMSIISGLAVTIFIMLLSGKKKAFGTRMILIGIGTQAILNALISWMLLKGSEYDVASALRWLRGSLGMVTLSDIPMLLAITIPAAALLLFLERSISLLSLGEEYPVTLGLNAGKMRLAAACLGLLLSAGATAVTGPVASVAFLSGPISSKLAKGTRSSLLLSGLTGAILVLAGELLGQNAFATRYPVGVITGLLGAPYLLMMLVFLNKKGAKT